MHLIRILRKRASASIVLVGLFLPFYSGDTESTIYYGGRLGWNAFIHFANVVFAAGTAGITYSDLTCSLIALSCPILLAISYIHINSITALTLSFLCALLWIHIPWLYWGEVAYGYSIIGSGIIVHVALITCDFRPIKGDKYECH